MVALNTGFPSGPVVDPATGELTVIGRAFFIALWNRTGAAVGLSSGDAAASIAAETAARQAADVGLTAAVSTEGTTRATADSALGARITNEAMIRATADSQLQIQVVTANLPSILTEDAITSLKVSAMPAVNTATLAGTELFTATQAGVNASWALNSLYTITAAIGNFLATNPLDAPAGSDADGKSVIYQGGTGDGISSGGGGYLLGGNGGTDGPGGPVGLIAGNAGGGDNDGGDVEIAAGTGLGAGVNGNVKMATLPTVDPGVSGAVWADNGALVLSGFTAGGSFAASDLSGLPSSDPGGGLPWLNGGVLQVGP